MPGISVEDVPARAYRYQPKQPPVSNEAAAQTSTRKLNINAGGYSSSPETRSRRRLTKDGESSNEAAQTSTRKLNINAGGYSSSPETRSRRRLTKDGESSNQAAQLETPTRKLSVNPKATSTSPELTSPSSRRLPSCKNSLDLVRWGSHKIMASVLLGAHDVGPGPRSAPASPSGKARANTFFGTDSGGGSPLGPGFQGPFEEAAARRLAERSAGATRTPPSDSPFAGMRPGAVAGARDEMHPLGARRRAAAAAGKGARPEAKPSSLVRTISDLLARKSPSRRGLGNFKLGAPASQPPPPGPIRIARTSSAPLVVHLADLPYSIFADPSPGGRACSGSPAHVHRPSPEMGHLPPSQLRSADRRTSLGRAETAPAGRLAAAVDGMGPLGRPSPPARTAGRSRVHVSPESSPPVPSVSGVPVPRRLQALEAERGPGGARGEGLPPAGPGGWTPPRREGARAAGGAAAGRAGGGAAPGGGDWSLESLDSPSGWPGPQQGAEGEGKAPPLPWEERMRAHYALDRGEPLEEEGEGEEGGPRSRSLSSPARAGCQFDSAHGSPIVGSRPRPSMPSCAPDPGPAGSPPPAVKPAQQARAELPSRAARASGGGQPGGCLSWGGLERMARAQGARKARADVRRSREERYHASVLQEIAGRRPGPGEPRAARARWAVEVAKAMWAAPRGSRKYLERRGEAISNRVQQG